VLLSANDIVIFLAFAVLTGVALWLLLRPLRADAAGSPADEGESEVAIYRDQLAEISRDLERGTIAEAEAEAARVEVSRRLIAADEARAAARRADGAANPRWRKGTALALALGLPVFALAVYLAEGTPGMSGQPIAERMEVPAEKLPVEGLVARVERRLKERPGDVQGWETIAPAYLMLGRTDDAAHAWTRAMMAGGVTADRLAARGEALVLGNDGVVGSAAKEDFERAVELDPDEPRAQFYLGAAELEAGEREVALARWKALLARAPENAPWAPALRARIAAVEGRPVISAEDEPMIRGMVEGLAARLADNPDDLDGWLRLIRSYGVLQDEEKAATALAAARQAFADDPDALARLSEAEAALDT